MKQIDLDELKTKYFKIGSYYKVGKIFGISSTTVMRKLRSLGINKKNRHQHVCNHNFFSQNTIQSFYWAGFIAADGNIYEKHTDYFLLQLALGKIDDDHIKKFISALDCNNTIYADRMLSRVQIYSNQICNDLKLFNIVPRKTHIYEMPEWLLRHELLNHFIRGYVDGDGSFFEHNNKTIGQLVFSVRGTKKLLEQFEIIFRKQLCLKPKQVEISNNWPLLRYEGNRAATKIRDYLYTDSTEESRLARKFNIAQKFSYSPHLRRAKPIRAFNTNTYILFESIADAERQGYIKSSIYQCLRNKNKEYKCFKWKYE